MAVKQVHTARISCYTVARDGAIKLTAFTDHGREIMIDIPADKLAAMLDASNNRQR